MQRNVSYCLLRTHRYERLRASLLLRLGVHNRHELVRFGSLCMHRAAAYLEAKRAGVGHTLSAPSTRPKRERRLERCRAAKYKFVVEVSANAIECEICTVKGLNETVFFLVASRCASVLRAVTSQRARVCNHYGRSACLSAPFVFVGRDELFITNSERHLILKNFN